MLTKMPSTVLRLTTALTVGVSLGVPALVAEASAPMDGSGTCRGGICIMQAEDPGSAGSSRPAAPAAPAKARRSSVSPKTVTVSEPAPKKAWKPLTPAEMQRASAWDRRMEILCNPATALNGQTPAVCNPAPAPAPAAQPVANQVPAPPQFTPADATQAALELLIPAAPEIGSAPCTDAGCQGTVGVPVWLWTQPWEEDTATATAGPFTVTARAVPTQVVWSLGDGQTIVCTSPGTPYEKSMGWKDSPDCGGRYTKTGSYAITATMTYQVTWSGADSGSDTITTTSTTNPFRVGEYQVVITSNS